MTKNKCECCGEPVRSTGKLYKVLGPNETVPEIEYFYCENCKTYSQVSLLVDN